MTYWFNKELKNIISETYNRTHDSIYPCSMNFPLWHSGIHIDTNNVCIKNIISDSEIVASNINSDYVNGTQSDSFILAKHTIKINKTDKDFYVLYSNLQPLKAYKFQKKITNEIVNEIKLSEKSEYTCSFQDLPFYCKSQLFEMQPKNQVKYIDNDVFEGNTVYVNDKNLLLQNDMYVLPPPLKCTILHNNKSKSLMSSNLAFNKDKNFDVKINTDTLFYSIESKTKIGKLKEGFYKVVDNNTSGDYVTIQISGSNISEFMYEGIVNFPKSKENIFYRVAAKDIYAAIRNADNSENPDSLQNFQKKYFPLSEITSNNNLHLYNKILNDEGCLYLKNSYLINLQKTYRITAAQLTSLKKNNQIFYETFISVQYTYDNYYIISFSKLNEKINALELYDKKFDNICIYSNNNHYLPIEESGNNSNEDINTVYFTLEDSVKKIKYISLPENDFFVIKNYIKSIKIIESINDSKQLYHFYNRDNSYLSGIIKYPFKITVSSKLKAPLSHLCRGSLYLTQATSINVSISKNDIVDARAYATIKNAKLLKNAIPLRRNNEIVGLLEEKEINFSENIFYQMSNDTNLTCTINNKNYTISLDDIKDAKLKIINESIKNGTSLPTGTNIGIGNNRFGKKYIDLALFTKPDNSNFSWEREYISKGTKLYKTKDSQFTKKVFFPDGMKITRKNEIINEKKVVKIQPSILMFRVYYDYVNQKRIKEFKETDTKTEPFKKDKDGKIVLYCGLFKGFSYKDNKVSIIQNKTNDDMEALRKLIEDYLNGNQQFISYENKTANGYYLIYADCSGLSFYEDYYLTDNPEIKDETESVYIDNEKANIIKELALKSSFEIEMSDEITETDADYFATFSNGTIQTKDKKKWKSINVNGLGDFYVPEPQQLLKKDFLEWETFKEVKNKAKNKIEFDFQTIDEDLQTNIDYSKVSEKLGLKNISVASYNLLVKILTNNDTVDFINSESSDDLIKETANKILNAFYNGKFIHPLECDSSLYNDDIKKLINVPDENFDKQKNSINMFSKMKKVFSENLFAFYNPICFLDKLDKAGLFEFNPYEKFNKIPTSFKMQNNPGFIPDGYFSYTQDFNEYVNDNYSHEGVDLAVGADNCGLIGIKSGISGKVIVEGDKGNCSYGCFLVIMANNNYGNKYRYYLLGHLDRSKKHKYEDDLVFANDIVGYIGNTGHCKSGGIDMKGEYDSQEERKAREDGRGAHLHLQLFLTDKDPKTFIRDMNFQKLKNAKGEKDVIAYKNVGIVNPFNYNEIYILDGKK